VNASDLTELHYITPIANITSILKLGILSHSEVQRRKIKSVSVAAEVIQERRKSKLVPGAKPLHEYVNLYICARNPMMYMRCSHHTALCVLRINSSVLSLPGVIIADGNAASSYTSFWPSPSGLAKVDRETVCAERWTDPNQFVAWENKRVKCAEVLVPEKLDARFIIGAYVSCGESESKLKSLAPNLPIIIDPHMFFRA
jgi:hypothetical protein